MTSTYLQDYLDESDRPDDAGDDALSEQDVELRNRLQDLLSRTPEELWSEDQEDLLTKLHEHRHIGETLLDDYYCRHFLRSVSGIVKRSLRFDPVFARQVADPRVSGYLQESVRCFSFGFFQGAVALARTALELAMRDCTKNVPTTDLSLADLLKLSSQLRLVNSHIVGLAYDVKRVANEVIHARPVTQEESFEVLVKTRAVLEQLYASKP